MSGENKYLLELISILEISRIEKAYKTADLLKEWIENVFNIRISYTKNNVWWKKKE